MNEQIKVSAIVSCFNGSKYLPAFLENCTEQTIVDRIEIVLVHNNPTSQELEIVKKYQNQYPSLFKHIIVTREPFAVSVNRAIKISSGEYVCVWNIDDLRTPNSLELMFKTLDTNPNVGFTYGDYIIVNKWQGQTGRLITEPEYEQREFIYSMHLGPFYMWRKNLCERIGYWDEQFKSGSDFDYASRLAVESVGLKTQGLLGYYLDEGLGLSTGKTPWQPIERTAIELRFGALHKLDFWYYTRAQKYRIEEVLTEGIWYSINKLMPNYKKYYKNRIYIIYAVVRYPFWLIQRVFNKLRRYF